jgi:D-sedoheptulose 7-phosphate isomerase
MSKQLSSYISEHIKTISSLKQHKTVIEKSIELITRKLSKGGKILLCGNGGSAADAQHLAAEFLVRLNPKKNRPAIPAITLATDMSTITACGNDYNFDKIFQRTFEAIFKKNDVLIAISTSGKSKNIINVLKSAKKNQISTIGFLGNKGGLAKILCDLKIVVNSSSVARIQESHIFIGHYIFDKVEENLFK